MRSRTFVFLVALATVLPMTLLFSAPIMAQQPAQQQPAQQPPAQQPAQPLPPAQPSQPAPQQTPTQPTTQPAPAGPQATGPSLTVEGAVTNVVGFTCGAAASTTAMTNQPPTTTNPSSMPGTTSTGTVAATQTHGNGQGCSAVLMIAPGVGWEQVVHGELTETGETAGGPGAGYFIQQRVVVPAQVAMTTHDNADLSLLDLTRGAVVKVTYTYFDDAPVATSVDVIWHAGQ